MSEIPREQWDRLNNALIGAYAVGVVMGSGLVGILWAVFG